MHEVLEETPAVVFLKGRLCDDVKLEVGKGYSRLVCRATALTKSTLYW